ncbi:ComEC/Rec2 family competence protein [Nitratifractor sp.]
MVIEKLPLFVDRRERLGALALWLLLLGLHLLWLHRQYQTFVDRPFYYSWGTVLNAIPKTKEGQSYQILKVHIDGGLTFYTRSYRRKSLLGKRLRLQLFPRRVTFLDWLRTPYIPARIKEIREGSSPQGILARTVAAQHRDPAVAAFYNAIFFATPIPQDLRKKISALGINHLVALSGFHLTILWGGIFLLLAIPYRLLQQRFFPWRYELLDLGTVSLILLAAYLWLTGPPPSLLRSYLMLAMGWAALLLGMELLSFEFLAVVAALLLLVDPRLTFSLGFWLSIGGVFYIYLLLHYWKDRSSRLFATLILPAGIYLAMLPIGHALFPIVSLWQWLSPLLSLLFAPFYPLAILAHLIGLGGSFDPALLALWNLPGKIDQRLLPLWVFLPYLLLSLAAIRWRWALTGMAIVITGSAFWIYAG